MHPVLSVNDKKLKTMMKDVESRFSRDSILYSVIKYYFCHIYHNMSINDTIAFCNKTDKTGFFSYVTEVAKHIDNIDISIMDQIISTYQNGLQVEYWMRIKQSYTFNNDILNELIRTTTKVNIPYDVFTYLPHHTLYLDFSKAKSLTDRIDFDGALVTVQTFANSSNDQADKEYYAFMCVLYKDSKVFGFNVNIMQNNKNTQEKTMDELVEYIDSSYEIEYDKQKLQSAILFQSLLYLCSYEPDIRETPASKMQYRKAKKNKKSELPIRDFEVGERFGEAFRKWTNSSTHSSGSGESNKHKRPHIRRAHWHQYWVGKHNSEDRKLILKWTSECFCGVTDPENQLSVVKHHVKK